MTASVAKSAHPLRLLLSVDVEEEGLFRGRYPHASVTARNVADLWRIIPLLERFSLPVTLFCTHCVFQNPDACRALDALRGKARVEIGAHLHHWNTPPFIRDAEAGGDQDSYVYPAALPPDLFQRRMDALFQAGLAFSGQPLVSFRMGRWHLQRWHWPYLAERGVRVDASVRPLHRDPRGPDYFYAPAEPYSFSVGGASVIEAPLTCIPLYAKLPRQLGLLERAAAGGKFSRIAQGLHHSLPYWGAPALLPVRHPLWLLKRIAGLHLARGGRFLSFTWHSSELMPGGVPHMPDERAVSALCGKLESFVAWLHRHWSIVGMTAGDLTRCDAVTPLRDIPAAGDWCFQA